MLQNKENSGRENSPKSGNYRRFDRINPSQNVNIRQSEIFVECCTDRVILDFDNNIPVHSPAQTSAQTPIKTYDEELQDLALMAASSSAASDVAEAAMELDKTPSIAPFDERHQGQSNLSKWTVLLAVLLCSVGAFAIISYHPLRAHSEQVLIRKASERALDLSPQSLEEALAFVETAPKAETNESLIAYRLFLQTWHERMDANASQVIISPQDARFPRSKAAAQAAFINQLLASERVDEAIAYHKSLSVEIFAGQSDYRHWIEASIAVKLGNFELATKEFSRMLQGKLSSFAIHELAFLAIKENSEIARHQFLSYALSPKSKDLPLFARCALSILSPEIVQDSISYSEISQLSQPYRDFCGLSIIQTSLSQNENSAISIAQLHSIDSNNFYFLKISLLQSLKDHAIESAIARFQAIKKQSSSLEIASLETQIVQSAFSLGESLLLRQLYPEIPEQANVEMLLRFFDVRKSFPEQGFDFSQANWPEFLSDSSKVRPLHAPSDAYLSNLHNAYLLAFEGHLNEALKITGQLMATYPQHLEPVLMQARFLAARGDGREAAEALENLAKISSFQAPLLTHAALYRARANVFNPLAFVVQKFDFEDRELREAQCEILWHQNAALANICIKNLAKNTTPSRTAQLLRALNSHTMNPQDLLKALEAANVGALSFPGLHQQRAEAAMKAKLHKEAVRAFQDSILFPPHDLNAPAKLADYYASRYQSFEGTKTMESILKRLPKYSTDSQLLGNCHRAAAKLYRPESASPQALKHLLKAKEHLGSNEEILKDLISYYRKKEKYYFVKLYSTALEEMKERTDDAM